MYQRMKWSAIISHCLKMCSMFFQVRLILIDVMFEFFVCDLTSGLCNDKLFLVTVVQS